MYAIRSYYEWNVTDNLFLRLSGDRTEDSSSPKFGHRLTVGNISGAPILDNVFDSRGGLNVPDQDVTAWGAALLARITSYNVCYTKLLREHRVPAARLHHAVEEWFQVPGPLLVDRDAVGLEHFRQLA